MDDNPNEIFDLDVINTGLVTKEEHLTELRDATEGTFLEGLPDELEENANMDWMDVLVENESEITVDAVIGQEGIDGEDIMEKPEIIKLLAKSDKSNWNDPSQTLSIAARFIGEAIEGEFDSDSELIEYVETTDENILFEGESAEDLREDYSKLRNTEKEEQSMNLLSLFTPDGDFSSLFAQNFIAFAEFIEFSQALLDGWENEPEVGQYGVIELSPQERDVENPDNDIESTDTTHHIVVKFVDDREDGLSLNDILKDIEDGAKVPEEENYIVESVKHYRLELISYDTELLEYYLQHRIIKADPDEDLWITPGFEEEFHALYDENPLPLDE